MSWTTIQDGAAGRESRSAWIALVAFWISAFKFLVNGMTVKFWGNHIDLGTVDAALLGAFLGTCLTLYFGRRFIDAWEHRGISTEALRPPEARPEPGPGMRPM